MSCGATGFVTTTGEKKMPPIAVAMALAQFAPQIVKWMTGSDKAEAVTETVVGIAKQITGTSTPEEALKSISANAEMALQFRLAISAQEADLDKAFLADRADARKRDVELAKVGITNRRADMMVIMDVIGLVTCLAVLVLFQNNLPGEVVGIVSTIAGLFGACLRDAHQFEFGSSRSSRDKDQTITSLSRG